jgi:hypothetical protein
MMICACGRSAGMIKLWDHELGWLIWSIDDLKLRLIGQVHPEYTPLD